MDFQKKFTKINKKCAKRTLKIIGILQIFLFKTIAKISKIQKSATQLEKYLSSSQKLSDVSAVLAQITFNEVGSFAKILSQLF